MNSLMENVLKKENILPTLVSFLLPAIQILAVVAVDVSNTLRLKELFLKSEFLPLTNISAIATICTLIGLYWYWKENYNLIVGPVGENRFVLPQRKTFNFLVVCIIVAILSSLSLITLFILGQSKNENLLKFSEITAIFQLIIYFIFLVSTGICAYIGLIEYSKKQRDFKPEQYLDNLRLTMKIMAL